MKVAIHQPNYIPWCGYFNKCVSADYFVFLDDVQMPGGQSYVSRVKIKKAESDRWLTQPIKRNFGQLIREVKFSDPGWALSHLSTIKQTYRSAPYFDEVLSLLEPLYTDSMEYLAEFNIAAVNAINRYLGISIDSCLSGELNTSASGDARLVEIVKAVGGDVYISGAGGKNYQQISTFRDNGIELLECAYTPVPYDRGDAQFIPGLSILDALFYRGRFARELIGGCS